MKKLLSVILVMTSFFSWGQTKEEKLYNWFDEEIGIENTDSFQGELNRINYKIYNNYHPFFSNNSFSVGSIKYKNQNYSNLKIKYNLFTNKVVLSILNKDRVKNSIVLFNEDLLEFSIENHVFRKIDAKEVKGDGLKGFYEVLIDESKIKLFLKRSKYKKEVPINGKMYAKFIANKNEYYVNYNSLYYKVKSKNDFIKIFPRIKGKIKKFYITKSALRKRNKNSFFIDLCKYINENYN